ncbi:hypothetical protein [Dactylosporangium matsuzakiense]|uniref:ABC-2 type transport system permease protein n=1 Tax=Dactylosporangium matsuzakiense TaxID=53360 RepID=A0A9W6KVV7_9ACTN|nr:hypothetical protein [Dactylosporangium matsuzakiense]UWZ47792.1 hypothetical protein Dmats_16145 [Dactylosporangium matsuzakiense]GLL07654.1 hypothetical protein GCM10017581_094080 [Dactylosporangium matsuzakiense]
MTPWRLEWLRMTRSARGITLIAVYAFFGLAGPLLAKYMAQIVKLSSSDVTIIAPPPEPADGIENFISQGSQTGLIVLAVVAAGVLSLDAHRGLAIFYRTRATGWFTLVWPRFVAVSLTALIAYFLGTAAAWFETTVVLAPLPTARVLLGALLGAVFLVFAVAVVTAAATVSRTTLATVGISLGVLLLVLPVSATVPVLRPWLPSSLLTAPAAVLTDAGIAGYGRAVAVSLAATVALLSIAAYRTSKREV